MQRILILVIFAMPAFADQLQTRPEVLRLSLKQAVEIALAPEGSTRVQLAGEALKQAKAKQGESRAALLPDLESYVSYQDETRNLRVLGLQFPSFPFDFSYPRLAGPFNVFDARLQVNQSVFNFSDILRYRASKTSVEAVKSDVEGTRDQVTDQVARVYLTGLRAQTTLETAKANVQLSEALLRLARSQKEAGTGTGIEVTRAEVQLANDQQRLLVAEHELESSHLQLLKALGLRLENPVELTDKLEYVAVPSLETKEAIETAVRTRHELKAQQERESTAGLTYRATKMERLPSVGAFADYGSIGTGINNAIPTQTLGVTLRVPLFDGGRRDARRAESASQYRQERIRTTDLHDQIEMDVRIALDALRSADAQVKAAEDGLRLSESELAQAQRRYKAGVANGIEVTDAQTRLDRARENQISALYNYNLARIDLKTAMGTIQSVIQ